MRPLERADSERVLALLRARPIHNVLLHHVVRAGALGRMPGFFGYERDGDIEGVLMVGASGGASLEVRHPDAFGPLAECATRLLTPPRHLTGSEDVTLPFWREYSRRSASELLWERREHVYVCTRPEQRTVRAELDRGGPCILRRAREQELDAIVENSALQHVEDLKEDRRGMDPAGFRARHLGEIRDGHWWVLAEKGGIRFQVHVGPRNEEVIQLGGVFTPPGLRGRGFATRGLHAIVALLLCDRPAVSLFCDESNAVACRLYDRVGFERRFYNRSYLLRPGAGASYV